MTNLKNELLKEIREIEEDSYLTDQEKTWAYEDALKEIREIEEDLIERLLKNKGVESMKAAPKKVEAKQVTNEFGVTYRQSGVIELQTSKPEADLFIPTDLIIKAYDSTKNPNRPIVVKAVYTDSLGFNHTSRQKAYSIKNDKHGDYIDYRFEKEFKTVKVYL